MNEPDEDLIEAIAARIRHDLKTRTFSPDPITGLGGMGLTEFDIARAAYAAMVEHLGLVEETRPSEGNYFGMTTSADLSVHVFGRYTEERRLVSPWKAQP